MLHSEYTIIKIPPNMVKVIADTNGENIKVIPTNKVIIALNNTINQLNFSTPFSKIAILILFTLLDINHIPILNEIKILKPEFRTCKL